MMSSAEELTAVQDFIQSEGLGPMDGVWVDGSDAAMEGVWLTSAGEVMTYLGWTTSEPDGDTRENCMLIRGQQVLDLRCNKVESVHSTLCEL